MVRYDEIARTDEQIKRLKEAIQKALDERQDADEKTEMRQLIEELDDALNGKLPADKTGELYWWLIGKSSLLAQNFGIEEYG
jgi:hypothetical protein